MLAHLKSENKDIYEKVQKDAQPQIPTTSLTQQTLKQVLEKTTKWTLNDPRTEEIDKLLMERIATDILPFAVVEGAGFKRVIVMGLFYSGSSPPSVYMKMVWPD